MDPSAAPPALDSSVRFLLEAGRTLGSSLDYEETLATVARLAVPHVADWAGVDLLVDGEIRRLAVAHVDPDKVALARELHERYPPVPDAPMGLPRVLRTGEAELVPEIPDSLLVAAARDEEHLRMARELGLHSYMIVPLAARGRVLGAISFVSAESGRRYGPADLALAEELASRAASAIDNARLFSEVLQSRAELEQQALELELQAEELQAQGAELEETRAELEATNDELQSANAELEARIAVERWSRGEAERAVERMVRLQQVTAAFSEAASPERVAEVVVEQGVSVMGACAGVIAVLSDDGDWLEVVRAQGLSDEVLARFRRFPVQAPFPLSEAVRECRGVYVSGEEQRRARYPELAEAHPVTQQRAWASLPLVVEGRVLGGLALSFAEAQEFGAEDRRFIEALAQQCAQAVERSRLYAAERQARHAAERLQELASGFTEAISTTEVGDVVMRHGVAAQGAAAGVLALLAPGGEELEIVSSVGYPPAACMGPGRRWPAAANIPIAEAARTGEPVFLKSPEEWAEHYQTGYSRPGSTSAAWAAVPVSCGGGTCGALLWTYLEPRGFGAAECALMLAVARLCSQALERARLYEAEREARAEAEEANRSKAEFLSTMSHELRTPLNAIGGYVDLIDLGIRGPVTDEQRSDLARIRRSQQVLLSLINDVLNYARLEAGRLEMVREEVPVVELLEGLEPLIAPQVRTRALAYACDPGEPGLALVGDPERIRQVLLNLLSNAIKFTDPGGSVQLSAHADGERVQVRVRDTGRGIPADRLDSIFDPFVQIDRHRTESSQQGVGLGLAISRELARGMGGDLVAASTEGEGSVFSLTLPRAR